MSYLRLTLPHFLYKQTPFVSPRRQEAVGRLVLCEMKRWPFVSGAVIGQISRAFPRSKKHNSVDSLSAAEHEPDCSAGIGLWGEAKVQQLAVFVLQLQIFLCDAALSSKCISTKRWTSKTKRKRRRKLLSLSPLNATRRDKLSAEGAAPLLPSNISS